MNRTRSYGHLKNEIKILCPGRKCGKCHRLIFQVEEAVKLSPSESSIIIVDSLNEILKYPTWILPTLVINNRVFARGYVPSLQKIVTHLNHSF